MVLEVQVECPKAIVIDVRFANGKLVSCPAGGKTRVLLTGDEYGRLASAFDAARREAKKAGALDEEVTGGGVTVLTEGYGDVPAGSKKATRLAAEAPERKARKAK